MVGSNWINYVFQTQYFPHTIEICVMCVHALSHWYDT